MKLDFIHIRCFRAIYCKIKEEKTKQSVSGLNILFVYRHKNIQSI